MIGADVIKQTSGLSISLLNKVKYTLVTPNCSALHREVCDTYCLYMKMIEIAMVLVFALTSFADDGGDETHLIYFSSKRLMLLTALVMIANVAIAPSYPRRL